MVYQTNSEGVFVDYVEADESPLEPGVFLIPAGCVVEEPPSFAFPQRARYADGAWIIEDTPVEEPEEEPVPEPVDPDDVPFSVSDRQFAQALAELGQITWSEARAWGARGEVPAQFIELIDQIPDEIEKQRALMFLEAAQTFERHHPMTLTLAGMLGWDDGQLDALWRYAATL